jgi:hypothetical protein
MLYCRRDLMIHHVDIQRRIPRNSIGLQARGFEFSWTIAKLCFAVVSRDDSFRL